MNEAIDAEHRALAVVDETPPPANIALFGTSDPVAVIANATRVADALKAMVVKKNLIVKIQGKEYPQVEAWQTLAVMLGLAAVCEWSRPVEGGWEARVTVQRNGLTIAAAEAQCLRTEKSKKGWEDYAIRSMAQTRATSKSLRSVLGFVMVLAGYEATPAEEMPDKSAEPKATPPPPPADSEQTRTAGAKACVVYAAKHRIPDEHRHELAIAWFGQPSTKELSTPDLRKLYELLVRYKDARGEIDPEAKGPQPMAGFEAWLAEQIEREAKGPAVDVQPGDGAGDDCRGSRLAPDTANLRRPC